MVEDWPINAAVIDKERETGPRQPRRPCHCFSSAVAKKENTSGPTDAEHSSTNCDNNEKMGEGVGIT